jgi:hypothetical protein
MALSAARALVAAIHKKKISATWNELSKGLPQP